MQCHRCKTDKWVFDGVCSLCKALIIPPTIPIAEPVKDVDFDWHTMTRESEPETVEFNIFTREY